MPDFATWLSGQTYSDEEARAMAAWNRIQDRATAVVFIRRGEKQPPQTVRIEVNPAGGEIRQGNPLLGTVGTQSVTVFGIRNHPSEPDTNMKRKDRFELDGKAYDITGITVFPGEIQAFGQVSA